ncbi:uncharacterized protein LOC130965629 [Arachis stenosperma]|uniref:uncharacterized protein LOC130965629 n=1 Tax=Arachis stenosperma TaxID=217475 RepID=UPI0025AC5EB4|nr:uncharacterized protein LOC130965629 [Arachis stenosperma]
MEMMVMKKTAAVFVVNLLLLVAFCSAIESPQYTLVHKESEFEIRLYRHSVWMSAPALLQLSFQKATWNGFHRLFQFIQGANLNFSRIPMTAPVLTTMVPGAGPLESQGYYVSLYLPVKFQATPPLPLPELNIKPHKFASHCIAVREFSGFAKDDRVVKEAQKLATSLSRSPWVDSTSARSSYSIAQYDAPFKIIKRRNEVWIDIDAPDLGCKSVGVAAY